MINSPIFYTLLAVALVALASVRAWLYRRDRWTNTFRKVARVEIGVITVLLVTMILLGCMQIVLRNFFHSGILWADLLMRHIVLWVGCLGGALATTRVSHINIDVFSRLLPVQHKALRKALVYSATAAAAFLLGIASLRLVVDERAFGEIAVGAVKTWMLQAVMPYAFFLISYRSVVNLITGRESALDGVSENGDADTAGAGEQVQT